jgi:DNA gyrase subunit B
MTASNNKKALGHFKDRSEKYNKSSNWVRDESQLRKIFDLCGIRGGETVLDLCSGTGLVAKQFKGKVREIIGLDISPDMTRQAAAFVDRMLIGPVEAIPLEANSVDVCVCRQGLQFVDLKKSLAEVARILKSGGRAVFCHLTAYGDSDAKDTFKIQALRNPSRANFFKPGDMEAAMKTAGLTVRETVRYPSRESVHQWINHGASTQEERDAIWRAYRGASVDFKRLHEMEETAGDILDTMLFEIVRAEKI